MAAGEKSPAQIAAENEAYAVSLEKAIEKKLKATIKMLVSQVTKTCQDILKELLIMKKDTLTTKNLFRHKHSMHKHGILRGHKYSEFTNSSAESSTGEKNMGCFYPSTISFIKLLMSEYMSIRDTDGNGLIFLKDFYIDYLDPNAPLTFKSTIYNIYFPEAKIYPYVDENGKDIKTDPNFIYYDFRWDGETFTYARIKRSAPLQKMSWGQYLSTVSHLL